MTKHAVFDCETLGKSADAVVLSIGIVLFDFNDKPTEENYRKMVESGCYVKFSVVDQLRSGRKTDDDTMNWWKQQSPEAREILHPTTYDRSVSGGLNRINEWLKSSGYDYKKSYCWSRGTYFDFPKFYSMYDYAGIVPGFNGWKIRDTRTMIDVLTGSERGDYDPKFIPSSFIAHHALHDAAMDAFRMMEIINDQG